MKACDEHKKVVIELKEISDHQKKKLTEYRETNSKLYDDIADLEVDIKEKENVTNKLRKQGNDNESEVKHLNEKVERKNEDILQMDFLLSKQKESGIIKSLEFENDDLKEQLDEAKVRIELSKKKRNIK